jgi:hypothetical protein
MEGKPRWQRFFLTGIFAALAVAVNPNSLVVLVPVSLYYFLKNFRNITFYVFVFCGIVLIAFLHHLALQFYISNPGYKTFELSAWRLAFHSELIPECFAMAGKLFKHLMPVAWNGGGFVFYFLVLLCTILFIQKKYIYAVCGLSGLAIIIYSFGLAKIQDGYGGLLLPYPRMFLAVPLFYGILMTWIIEKLKYANAILVFVLILGASHLVYKSFKVKARINTLVEQQQGGFMLLCPVSALKNDCVKFSQLAKENNAQLIVGFQWSASYLSALFYAGSAIDSTFPPTIFAEHDRRTWRCYEEEKTVRNNIIFIGGTDDFWNKISQKGFTFRKISNNPNVCVLENNNLKTFELLRTMEIEIRNY